VDRLRGTLANGGVAFLAIVFALAFAAFNVATALAQIAVLVFNQHVGSEDFDPLELKIFGTTLYLDALVQGVLTVLLIAAALYGVFRLTQRSVVTCPECLSDIPRGASVCRHCTADVRDPEPG
jgi:hypothetical protein